MEEAQLKIVECTDCKRPFEIPAKPKEDEAVICDCGALLYWSDYGVCKPGYTVTYMRQ